MSKKTVFLLVVVYLTAYSSVGFASDLEYKPGELFVKFAPKAGGEQRTKVERNAVLASISGGTVKLCYELVPGLTLVKLPENTTVQNALPRFKNASGILYAEPNYKIKRYSVFPNDAKFRDQWGLQNVRQNGGMADADIDAPEAWDVHTGSSEMVVAVFRLGRVRKKLDNQNKPW